MHVDELGRGSCRSIQRNGWQTRNPAGSHLHIQNRLLPAAYARWLAEEGATFGCLAEREGYYHIVPVVEKVNTH
jgi:hypothetical protein